MDKMPVSRGVVMAVNVLTNLDQISIVQLAIAKMGLYKWIAYCVYFVFFA